MAKAGVTPDLALRVYSTRLLGREPKLVLHGGGNTSVKTSARDLFGEEAECSASRAPAGTWRAIEPAGLPAVRLEPLRKLRARDDLSDEDMVRVQRANLIDPPAPNPSVETLLHAFMPHKFVDHTHATAVLSLIDQPDSEALCAEVYGGRLGFVPYVMPGFGLAKKAAEVFDKNPKVEGLILDKHGIFTFGGDAREAYERMIEMVTLRRGAAAEEPQSRVRERATAAADRAAARGRADPARRLRAEGRHGEGAHQRLILEFRTSDAILNFVNGKEVARYARAGVITPDHVHPHQDLAADRAGAASRQARRIQDRPRGRRRKLHRRLRRVFRAPQRARRRRQDDARSRCPASCWCRASACSGSAASAKDARIAADIAEAAVEGITDAEAIGRFTVDLRSRHVRLSNTGRWSWPSSAQRKPLPLAGQVAVVTGAGGAIGAATAQAPLRRPARKSRCSISTLRPRRNRPRRSAARRSRSHCDVTDAASVHAAFEQVVAGVRRRRHRGVECRRAPGRARSARSTRRCCAKASS